MYAAAAVGGVRPYRHSIRRSELIAEDRERTRDALALGAFVGVLLSFLVAMPVVPALGFPLGLVLTGTIASVPMFLLLAPRIGVSRALILAALNAAGIAAAFCSRSRSL